MRLTTKQTEIMYVLMKGNLDEKGVTISWCDVHQLRRRLSYEATREAILCSLKYLEKKGLVEIRPRAIVRDKRLRTLYVPTNLAFDELERKDVPDEVLEKELGVKLVGSIGA